MLPPILPASLEDRSPLYPSFKVTPTSLGVKNIFDVLKIIKQKRRKQSPKIDIRRKNMHIVISVKRNNYNNQKIRYIVNYTNKHILFTIHRKNIDIIIKK